MPTVSGPSPSVTTRVPLSTRPGVVSGNFAPKSVISSTPEARRAGLPGAQEDRADDDDAAAPPDDTPRQTAGTTQAFGHCARLRLPVRRLAHVVVIGTTFSSS